MWSGTGVPPVGARTYEHQRKMRVPRARTRPTNAMTLLIIFVALIYFYSLVAARVERTAVTAPIIFTSAGALSLWLLPELRDQQVGQALFLTAAEIGLVLLLFADAYSTDLNLLRVFRNLPIRLLSIGMLLTIFLGMVAAKAVLPSLSIWEAGILSAILAPTDAGLGQIIVTSPSVPTKIRQALNVEAGLNDGLSVPFLLFFIALASGGAAGDHASLTRFVVEQLGFGALIGAGIGGLGGWLLNLAQRREWIADSWLQLGVVALPLLSLLASEAVGASMFIAAFVAGLAVQFGFKDAGKHSVEFTDEWGQIFNLSVFFFFGLLVAQMWPQFNFRHVLYGILSLTVVRMVPVAISLVGTGLGRATVLFMGWFGPRGLASIVLALVYLEHDARHPGETSVKLAVMLTVLCSIFAHGLTALPGMALYAQKCGNLPPNAPELEEAG